MADYISTIRQLVGPRPLFVNAASGLVINESGEVLLQRRGKGEKENSCRIPGAIMEIGEYPRDTVKRELKEETNLDVEVGRFIGVYTTPELVTYPNGDVCQMVSQIFECKAFKGELCADGDETLELKFFPFTNRPKLFRPHLERALQDYEAGRFGNSN